MNDFIEKNRARLETFVTISHEVFARPDYVQGGGGNISIKLEDGCMAVKASGYTLGSIELDAAYAVLDYPAIRRFYYDNEPADFADPAAAGSEAAIAAIRRIPGLPELRPSVEAGFHALLSGFVLHSHSVYADLAVCSKEGEDIVRAALAGADYDYCYTRYSNPGALLTFLFRDELARQERLGKKPAVIFMENHGICVHHDDPATCMEIHRDVNERIANYFGIAGDSFPQVAVKSEGSGYVSDTPYLVNRLKGEAYPLPWLLNEPLYPDQMVFFLGALGVSAVIDRDTGLVHYDLPKDAALTIEQTLAAIAFIKETIGARGFTLSTMGASAQSFIKNWESEQYRKKIAEQQAAGK